MTTKKTTTKKEEKKEEKKVEYFYAVGRRKTAVAKIKLFPASSEKNSYLINDKKLEKYFPIARLQENVKLPVKTIGGDQKFEIEATVIGGGFNAQTDAVKLGIARALVVFDEELKKALKAEKLLTRDSREVERKKPGLKKARRAPQWAKR